MHSWGRGHVLSPDDAAGKEEEAEEEEPMEMGGAAAIHEDGGLALDRVAGEDEAGIGNAEEVMLWGQAAAGPRPGEGQLGCFRFGQGGGGS